MAGTSLFALLDDIATILDDVAILTKIAAKKTSGVLGDDLALNAQQVTGVTAEREIPVVYAVAKGSLINKLILIPIALIISAVANFLITPLLVIGGTYLCFEGFEKIFHHLTKNKTDNHKLSTDTPVLTPAEIVEFEKDKIKGAIKTDFILSAEIITIVLGTVSSSSLLTQIMVLTGIGLLMTIGVYGFVAAIVKLDDLGLYLLLRKKSNFLTKKIGQFLLNLAPILMRFLSIAGTLAMFLVGGEIISHGIPAVHHIALDLKMQFLTFGSAIESLISAFIGLTAGGVAYILFEGFLKIKKYFRFHFID